MYYPRVWRVAPQLVREGQRGRMMWVAGWLSGLFGQGQFSPGIDHDQVQHVCWRRCHNLEQVVHDIPLKGRGYLGKLRFGSCHGKSEVRGSKGGSSRDSILPWDILIPMWGLLTHASSGRKAHRHFGQQGRALVQQRLCTLLPWGFIRRRHRRQPGCFLGPKPL